MRVGVPNVASRVVAVNHMINPRMPLAPPPPPPPPPYPGPPPPYPGPIQVSNNFFINYISGNSMHRFDILYFHELNISKGLLKILITIDINYSNM